MQLLQFPAVRDECIAEIDVRFRRSEADDWEEGWYSLDSPVESGGKPAWALSALKLSDVGPVLLFGVADPDAVCWADIGSIRLALTGPTLVLVHQARAEIVVHSPIGRFVVPLVEPDR